MSKSSTYKRAALATLIGAALLCIQSTGLAAIKDMKNHLPDDYLVKQFDWSMVLYVPDTRGYLDYNGTSLYPITKVCVNFNEHATPLRTKSYEELWYHKKKTLGLRRQNSVQIEPDSDGTIIICPSQKKEQPDFAFAVSDTLVRLLVDIHFRDATSSHVMIPGSDYDEIVEALKRYGIYSEKVKKASLASCPLSVRLRTYPEPRDELFYLHR